MNWWVWPFIIVVMLYSVLTVFEVLRCPEFSVRDKILLSLFSIFVPIIGAYFSNERLTYKISEEGRADLLRELPFWVTFHIPAKTGDGDADSDADSD